MKKETRNCQYYEELISNALDKELDKRKIPELEEHIKNCKSCQKFQSLCQKIDKDFETFFFSKKTGKELPTKERKLQEMQINKAHLDLLGLEEKVIDTILSGFSPTDKLTSEEKPKE